MPFFDLFKKSPKKEPGGPTSRDASLFSPEMQKKRHDAAMEFIALFQEKTPLLHGRPHAGTVLAVPARLAGSSLYRALSYNKEIAPGTVVLSEEVNQAWPQLLHLFAFYCKQNGLDVMSKPPVTVFPEQNKPLMNVEQVLTAYQDEYLGIMQKHGLDYLEGARAGMIISSIVFEYHYKKAKDIDPFVAAGIVALGVVEGAKTTPPPLKPTRTAPPSPSEQKPESSELSDLILTIARNSTGGGGTRLVLGEGMSPMQEALSNGGKYILVHPEVLRKLTESQVDVFLVYEAALRLETAAKMPRIDFVGGNVDVLLQQWHGKAPVATPLHVRQVQWLQSKAPELGYERNGNSWIFSE
jgi:hypothetical protein